MIRISIQTIHLSDHLFEITNVPNKLWDVNQSTVSLSAELSCRLIHNTNNSNLASLPRRVNPEAAFMSESLIDDRALAMCIAKKELPLI